MTHEDFVEQLKRHEGYRDRIYVDTTGNLTCGWGHNLTIGSKVPEAAAKAFFRSDLIKVNIAYSYLKGSPHSLQLDVVRQYVIKNMLFNLGLDGVLGFKKMLAALKDGNYQEAAREMLDSKWSDQVGARAVELSQMMLTGKYHRR